VAKGSPGRTSIVVRGGENNKAVGWGFGPVADSDFQTFEIEATPANSDGVEYPVSRVAIFIINRDSREGFFEISKIAVVTD